LTQRLHAITVEQLVALNDEIRALVRAGVPLERGLRALGHDLPGRLGRLAGSLAERLEHGESLVEVLESNSQSFPPAYRAVVAAGLRSGRLPVALESIARSVRHAAELRRTLIVALSYPIFLALVATAVFVLSVTRTAPVVREIYGLLDVVPPVWYEWMTAASDWTYRLLPWLWAAALAALVAWWLRSRRAARWGTGHLGWVPSVSAVRSAGRMATFAEVLAALVEQQAPLDEAVVLAAAAGGGPELKAAGSALAEALRRGESSIPPPRGIPPLLSWLILTSPQQPHLVRALRQHAVAYRRRAVRMSLVLGTYLPIFLSAFLGGAIAAYYVALNLAPFYYLLYQLGQP
jgi:general secretion pathway protein F